MTKSGCVYIMSSKSGVLYIGVTSDLIGRIWEHKNDVYEGFTKRYKCHKLVYFEDFSTIEDAINKEKQLKNWHKQWKINLIRESNPLFKDLWEDIQE